MIRYVKGTKQAKRETEHSTKLQQEMDNERKEMSHDKVKKIKLGHNKIKIGKGPKQNNKRKGVMKK